MPPKRKRAEDTGDQAAASTRATRSSTRLSTGSTKDDTGSAPAAPKPAPAKKATAKAAPNATAKTEAPAAKKAKTTAKASTSTTKSTAKKAAPKKSAKTIDLSTDDDGEKSDTFPDDEPSTSKSLPLIPDLLPSTSTLEPVAQPKPKVAAPAAPAKQASVSKIEPYSPDRAASLFKKFADEDDPTVIGPEGFQNMCSEAQISLEGAGPLILAWQIKAKEMGKFTKDEWTKGTETLKISSLSGLAMAVSDLDMLLIQGQPAAKGSSAKKDPYDKFAYGKYAADPKAAFQTLYSFCFTLAKPEQSRNIDMETSTALWSVLLVPQYPIMSEVLEFIAEKGTTYKATNKDLWGMMLEFCRTVEPTLHDYEADGAWPTLLDDFVAWKKAKTGNGAAPAE